MIQPHNSEEAVQSFVQAVKVNPKTSVFLAEHDCGQLS